MADTRLQGFVRRGGPADPVKRRAGHNLARHQERVFAVLCGDQAIACGVLCDHDPRRITCIAYATDTQTAALTQRVIHQALMLADHPAAVLASLPRTGPQERGTTFANFTS